MKTHFTISQAAVIALVNQVVAFVAGFGVINSTTVGIVVSAATAAVNAAFLLANAVHALVHVHPAPAPAPVPPAPLVGH